MLGTLNAAAKLVTGPAFSGKKKKKMMNSAEFFFGQSSFQSPIF
jgi:hypothetical protein